jgi:hypothetical protein
MLELFKGRNIFQVLFNDFGISQFFRQKAGCLCAIAYVARLCLYMSGSAHNNPPLVLVLGYGTGNYQEFAGPETEKAICPLLNIPTTRG